MEFVDSLLEDQIFRVHLKRTAWNVEILECDVSVTQLGKNRIEVVHRIVGEAVADGQHTYLGVIEVAWLLGDLESGGLGRIGFACKCHYGVAFDVRLVCFDVKYAFTAHITLVLSPTASHSDVEFIFLVAPHLYESHPSLMSWYDPNYQVGYVFIVNLICTAAVTFGFIPELRDIRFGIDGKLLKDMLKYTWPLLLLGVIGILNQVADKICFKFIVPGQEGEVQLGIYGACVKIAMIIAIFTQAFRYAYEPFVFGGQKDKNSKEMQADVMKYYVIFTLLAFLIVVLYMDIFKYIIQRNYWDGLRAVPVVMMAEIFMGIYFNLSFWYKLNKQTWWGAIFSTIGVAALLAINFIFVPKYGFMACAWGGFAGYGICMVLSYIVGQIKNPVPYKLPAIFGYFAFAMLLYYLSIIFRPNSQALVYVVNTVFLLLYIAVILYNERVLVKRVFSGIKGKLVK